MKAIKVQFRKSIVIEGLLVEEDKGFVRIRSKDGIETFINKADIIYTEEIPLSRVTKLPATKDVSELGS